MMIWTKYGQTITRDVNNPSHDYLCYSWQLGKSYIERYNLRDEKNNCQLKELHL